MGAGVGEGVAVGAGVGDGLIRRRRRAGLGRRAVVEADALILRQVEREDNDRLTFAYHLAYQNIIGGDPPFYVLQNITSLIVNKTVNEGLGNKNTIRGTLYNRFIGKGYVWGNFETRVKLFSFNLRNQAFYIASNPFFDCGAIVSPFRLDAPKGSEVWKQATKFHGSYGAGLKLVMNRNFVMSVEVARPLNHDDGRFGLIMGSNYLF